MGVCLFLFVHSKSYNAHLASNDCVPDLSNEVHFPCLSNCLFFLQTWPFGNNLSILCEDKKEEQRLFQ